MRPAVFALEYQQQRQHLNRLAQSHVVGQASAESEPGQRIEPPYSRLLVGPQAGLEFRPGINRCESLRPAQSGQGIRQPRAGRQLRPVGVGRFAAFAGRCTGQQAHRLGKRQAVFCRVSNGFKALQQAADGFLIDLDPATTDELQAIAALEQRLDLGIAQALAVQTNFHAEIQQRILAQQRWRPRPDAGFDYRARRFARFPAVRRPDDDAGSLELRQVGQKAAGIWRRPAQRMANIAGLDHLAQPVAVFGRALHWQQQRQQLLPAFAAGEFRQRFRQRLVLRLSMCRQGYRLGRQKSKRRLRILAIFSLVEMYAADQISGRITRFEEIQQRNLGNRQFLSQGGIHLNPQCGQPIGGDIFRTRHWRQIGDQCLKILGGPYDYRNLAAFGRGAQCDHIARGEVAPPGPGQRQNATGLRRPEP